MIESVFESGAAVTACAEWTVGVSGGWMGWLMMVDRKTLGPGRCLGRVFGILDGEARICRG
jgi:hypothetical protein